METKKCFENTRIDIFHVKLLWLMNLSVHIRLNVLLLFLAADILDLQTLGELVEPDCAHQNVDAG